MKYNILYLFLISLLVVGCNLTGGTEPDPQGTIYFSETDENFANPERGFLVQAYYESNDLSKKTNLNVIKTNRTAGVTLYLHSYYLTDYMESEISQEFLDRMEYNFQTLRAGGAKAVIRYSYKHSNGKYDVPYEATLEWIKHHVDQLAPYWQEYKDVILCLQAGFIGVWGEWFYTTNFVQRPTKDEHFAPRWEVLNYLLEKMPADRQVALRTPTFKRRYLKMHDMEIAPLTEHEAHRQDAKSRLCGFNDCFLASESDQGTYSSSADREFWAEDTKYTLMGGETCAECKFSNGKNALAEMEKYHWTYINSTYHLNVLNSWEIDGTMKEIKRRLGYRYVLDKAYPTQTPKPGENYTVQLTLRNVGFAALMNERDVELVLVNKEDPTQKYVYPQTNIDPRFWMPGDTINTALYCKLDENMAGDYKVYINMPDKAEKLHDNPLYSIRFANKKIWDEKTGYNYITDLTFDLPETEK
jgi:hypothetical protein